MLARGLRIAADQEIKRVLKLGRRFSAPECSIYTLTNTLGHPRVTVIAGGAVSKHAVDRNRVKRQMRDLLRRGIECGAIKSPVDIVVVVRAPALQVPDEERSAIFEKLLQKARILSEPRS